MEEEKRREEYLTQFTTDREAFMRYLDAFERRVLINGWHLGRWGSQRQVSSRPGKLEHTPIGLLLGTRFTYEVPLVLDYYGLYKKSTGLMSRCADLFGELNIQSMLLPVIDFKSVRLADICNLALDLSDRFPVFKQIITNAHFGIKAFPEWLQVEQDATEKEETDSAV